METISAEDLKRILTGADGTPVVNVLPTAEYERKHIPGTVNIPIESDEFVRRVEQRVNSKADAIVVYCMSASCDASERAAERLERAGFTNVKDYADGLDGWEQAGYRVESGGASGGSNGVAPGRAS